VPGRTFVKVPVGLCRAGIVQRLAVMWETSFEAALGRCLLVWIGQKKMPPEFTEVGWDKCLPNQDERVPGVKEAAANRRRQKEWRERQARAPRRLSAHDLMHIHRRKPG
jgi:hypothetical protein